ncbi:uncharacterized protein LOC135698506 [Ochlerotatus camptorhynchus]|uniref:uncharacterized protein LOC135698506 n=1 Tax=Ochlerotatus camptorhynchus TaxID=644619 RepID=UPI0031E032E4
MKTLVSLSLLVLISLLASSFVLAERDESLQVFTQLKRSKKILSGFSDYLATAQSDVILTEESYIQTAINDESALLNQLSGSDVQVSGPQCVQFIRQSANILMSLTGIAYANCLNDADDQVFSKLSQIDNLQLSREQYEQFNLLGAFRGENIFVDPAKLRNKLSERSKGGLNLPTLSFENMDALQAGFNEIKTSVRSCMTAAQGRLSDSLKFAALQVRSICAGEASKQI